MNTLRIQQGNNIEVVTTDIIKKLYDVALSIPTPLEGETDPVYLSGNLLIGRTYENQVKYLAGTVLVRGAGSVGNNPTGRFRDLLINVTDDYYISFEDDEVFKVLLNNGYSLDGIGITKNEAASASNFGVLFRGNSSITSFPEFKYFTASLTATGGSMFEGCSNLTNIDLSLLRTTKPYAFRNSGIQTVNAPNATSWGEETFNLCRSLTTVTDLGTPTVLPRQIFGNCTALTSVNIPSTCTTLEGLVFESCTALVFDVTNLPQTITLVGQSAFNNCTNVTGVLNCPNLTSLGLLAFRASGITSVSNLGSITNIPNYCFSGCTSLETVTLPSGVTSIGLSAFNGCTSLSGVTQQKFPNLTNIGQRCFEKSSITGHWDLTNITNIGNRAFYGSAVTEITISDALLSDLRTILGYFGACRDVTKINANYRITSVNPVFPAMSSLLPFVLYLPLTTLLSGHIFSSEWTDTYNTSSGSKSSCPHWTHLYYPNLTTTVYSYCYFNNNGDNVSTFTASGSGTDIDLIYVKNVLTLDKHTFPKSNRIEAFVINNTTVPKIISHERNGLTTQTEVYAFSGWDGNENGYSFPASSGNAARYHMIYVPDSAVQDYKTAWPILADHIYSIHDLNNGVIYTTEADWTAAGKPAGLIAEYLGLSTADLASFVTANNLTYWTNPNA